MNGLHLCAFFVKFAIVGYSQVGVEMSVPDERSLWDEEYDQWKHCTCEYGNHVERPFPTNGARHLPNNDGREECTTEQAEVGQGHPLASLVNEVQISNAGVNQRLERSQSYALEEPCSGQRHVRMVRGQVAEIACSSPC